MVFIWEFIKRQIYFFSFNSLVILLIINLIAIPFIQLLQQSNNFSSVAYAQQQIAIVAPPPTSAIIPGQEYHLSLEQEAQLIDEKIVFDGVTPADEIPTTIDLKGRQWFSCVDQTICNTPEMKIVTSIEKVKDLDILILLGILGSGAVARVIVLGIALVGPKVASMVGSAGSFITWANSGIAGAIQGVMLNALVRYNNAPAWFQRASGLSLGFAQLAACEQLVVGGCPYMAPLPATSISQLPVRIAGSSIPTRIFTNKMLDKAGNRIGIKFPVPDGFVDVIAASVGYKDIPRYSENTGYSITYRNGDKILKIGRVYLGEATLDLTREIDAIKKVQGLSSFPKFYRDIRVNDLPQGKEKDLLIRNGLTLSDPVGYEMEFIDGRGLGPYISSGGKISRAVFDETIRNYDELKRLVGGLGDHWGQQPNEALANGIINFNILFKQMHSKNTIFTPEGKIRFIDFGGRRPSDGGLIEIIFKFERDIMIWRLSAAIE